MSCLSFWVPPPGGRLHPSVIEMLGGSEFRLRRGFACGKTLVRRKSAAPPCGAPCSAGIYTVAMFQKERHDVCRVFLFGFCRPRFRLASIVLRCSIKPATPKGVAGFMETGRHCSAQGKRIVPACHRNEIHFSRVFIEKRTSYFGKALLHQGLSSLCFGRNFPKVLSCKIHLCR